MGDNGAEAGSIIVVDTTVGSAVGATAGATVGSTVGSAVESVFSIGVRVGCIALGATRSTSMPYDKGFFKFPITKKKRRRRRR